MCLNPHTCFAYEEINLKNMHTDENFHDRKYRLYIEQNSRYILNKWIHIFLCGKCDLKHTSFPTQSNTYRICCVTTIVKRQRKFYELICRRQKLAGNNYSGMWALFLSVASKHKLSSTMYFLAEKLFSSKLDIENIYFNYFLFFIFFSTHLRNG